MYAFRMRSSPGIRRLARPGSGSTWREDSAMPLYDVTTFLVGLGAIVFAPYLGRIRMEQLGVPVRSGAAFSRWWGAALVAVSLADYGSILAGWGSIFRVFGVQ
jgi:hypothetical protein